MAFYNYKAVCHREDFTKAEAEWVKANGECDGDPGYDGHYWLIAGELLDSKDATIKALLEALRDTATVFEVHDLADKLPETYGQIRAALRLTEGA